MNRVVVFIFIVAALLGCKKDYLFDQEEGMETGSAIVLKGVEVIDIFPEYLTGTAYFVALDGLMSVSDFSDSKVEGVSTDVDVTTIINSYKSTPNSTNGYKNLILINSDRLDWLDTISAGYYMNRYFRQVESNTKTSVAVASIGKDSNFEPVFFSEGSTIFDNSANFNIRSFYEITSPKREGELLDLKAILEGLHIALDSISRFKKPNENLAITFFLDGEYDFTSGTKDLLSDLFQKLDLNEIQMNIITGKHGEYDMQFAMYSGGLHQVTNGAINLAGEYVKRDDSQRVTEAGVVLQNLHELLLNRYRRHAVTFRLSYDDIDEFKASNYVFGSLKYNGFVFPITVNKSQ